MKKLVTLVLWVFVIGSVGYGIYMQTATTPADSVSGGENVESALTVQPSSADRDEAAPAEAEHRRIVAMYFHGDVRCATCRTVEAYAREAVENGFPERVVDGTVSFIAVNVDRPENSHYVDDYQLVARTVVVAEEIDGVITRWNNLDQVWTLVGNHDAYLGYVRGAVSDLLEQV